MSKRQENLILEIMGFLDKCDKDYSKNIFNQENAIIAANYLRRLKNERTESNLVNAVMEKLNFVYNQIISYQNNNHQNEAILNLMPLSITEYIIDLVKRKRLTEPVLISRFVYIELAKVLYYDVSYVRQKRVELKQKIVNAEIDEKTTKIFSYVVCTQWLKLYKYILNHFGINVIERNIEGEDHVWAEIPIDDNNIIIADATEYINSSIDFSNAKCNAPTSGFLLVPKEYSGVKLYDFFAFENRESVLRMKSFYDCNRDLDMDLGYIESREYPIEKIFNDNEIFNYSGITPRDEHTINRFMDEILSFFDKLEIPNNMDGYELFSYYNKFIRKLPPNISANIAQETLYVDSFSYRQRRMKDKFLTTPSGYLSYLEQLIYDRYYRYLQEKQKLEIESLLKSPSETSQRIAEYEMKIAEINRSINLFYAINKLHIYEPYTAETLNIQLYEPMMGVKNFPTMGDYDKFAIKNGVK